MMWECSLVYPFWCKILEILEEWLGSNIRHEPQLRFLEDKSVVPNVAKNAFVLIKVSCITAPRMILCKGKSPTPTPRCLKMNMGSLLAAH